MATKSSCTHPELIARVVALESGVKALRQVLDERDERYKQRASSQDAAVKNALDTSEKAIIKAETATERRFEGVNEFRQTLADQATMLMPRSEYTVQHKALEDKVSVLESRLGAMQQDVSAILARGGGIREAWGYIGVIAGLVIAVAAIYLHGGVH
jgi:hypothetical protein